MTLHILLLEFMAETHQKVSFILVKQNIETDLREIQNITPSEVDLDICRRIPEDIYQIRISKLELPYAFAQKFS